MSVDRASGIAIDKLFLRFMAHAVLCFEEYLDTALEKSQGKDMISFAHGRGWVKTALDDPAAAGSLKRFILFTYLSYFQVGKMVLYREVDANGGLNLHEAMVTEACSVTGRIGTGMISVTNRTGTTVLSTAMACLERVDDTYYYNVKRLRDRPNLFRCCCLTNVRSKGCQLTGTDADGGTRSNRNSRQLVLVSL